MGRSIALLQRGYSVLWARKHHPGLERTPGTAGILPARHHAVRAGKMPAVPGNLILGQSGCGAKHGIPGTECRGYIKSINLS